MGRVGVGGDERRGDFALSCAGILVTIWKKTIYLYSPNGLTIFTITFVPWLRLSDKMLSVNGDWPLLCGLLFI